MKTDVLRYIRTVPDYPSEGINFYDLNSLFAGQVWGMCVEELCSDIQYGKVFGHITHVVGIESRGFVVGQALASELMVPFVMMRKQGSKYPGELYSATYELEYGTDTLVLQKGILGHTSHVLIADDLVATGGSLEAAVDLVKQTGATPLACATVVDLRYLRKEDPVPIISMTEVK